MKYLRAFVIGLMVGTALFVVLVLFTALAHGHERDPMTGYPARWSVNQLQNGMITYRWFDNDLGLLVGIDYLPSSDRYRLQTYKNGKPFGTLGKKYHVDLRRAVDEYWMHMAKLRAAKSAPRFPPPGNGYDPVHNPRPADQQPTGNVIILRTR